MSDYYKDFRIRLDRANYRLHALKKEIKRWRNSKPFEVASVDDPKSGVTILVYKELLPLNPDWSLEIGDILFGYRAFLDNLMFDVVSRAINGPMTKSFVSNIAFPIKDRRSEFKGEIKRYGTWPSRDIKNSLGSLQPYNQTPPLTHPLAMLDAIHNIDKHRHIQIVAMQVKDIVITSTELFRYEFKRPVKRGVIKDGDVLAVISTKSDIKCFYDTITTEVFERASEPISTLNALSIVATIGHYIATEVIPELDVYL